MQHVYNPTIALLSQAKQLETRYMAEYINGHS